MSDTLERPALYYPYIHIRSEHWLKATLLCAPVVKRIVPETYTPEDIPNIVKYTEITGPNGTLLQAVPPSSQAAYQAQQRLLSNLREHETEIRRKYQRGRGPLHDSYWIHDAKFTDQLLEYLVRHKLAWRSEHSGAYGRRNWYALHQILGSAIMTTLGLSIAREEKYDIVTPSTGLHEMLLATNEDAVFDAILSTRESRPVPTLAQAQHDLGQLVITLTGVNYQALRPEDIPELQASRHFRKFQSLLRTGAQSVSRDDDPEAYEAQLVAQAGDIIDAWHETKNDLSKALKDALFENALTLSAAGLTSLVEKDATALVIAGGTSIVLLTYKRRRLTEKRDGNPYQYLTEILEAENETLRMTFPLGLEA